MPCERMSASACAGVEHDRLAVGTDHLQRLQLAALRQIGAVGRHEAVDEAVRLARVGVGRARAAADVRDQPDVAVGVGLDAFVAAAAEDPSSFWTVDG